MLLNYYDISILLFHKPIIYVITTMLWSTYQPIV